MNDKSNLSTEELETLNIEFAKRGKSPGILWLCWLFLGVFGAHRFYLGHRIGWLYVTLALLAFPTRGITAAVLVLLLILDAFANNRRLAVINERIEESVLSEMAAQRQSEAQVPAAVSASQDAVCAVAIPEEEDGLVACQECGAESSRSASYCSECGAKLAKGAASETDGTGSSVSQPEASPQSDSKDAAIGCVILVVLAVLVVLGVRALLRWLWS